MKILVTGATGFIGSKLVPFLELSGHKVIAPNRIGDQSADLKDPESFSRFVNDVDVVVQLAAFNPRAYRLASLNGKKMLRLNVDASAHLARLAAQSRCKLFLFASSARVYGMGESPYGEEAPLLASDNYGLSKIAAEKAILDALEGTSTKAVIFRLPVFAEKAGGLIGLASKLAAKRVPLPSQLMEAKKSIISIDTFCHAVLACLDHQTAFSKTLNLADKKTETIGTLCAQGLSFKPVEMRMPKFAEALLGHVPGIGYAWRHAISECVLDTSKFEAEFGVQSK